MPLFRFRPRIVLSPKLGLRGPDRYAPQKRGARDWDFDKLGLGSGVGDGADLTKYATVLSQGSTNSCVAHAWEQALLIESRRRGFEGQLGELGSRLFGYYNSRAEHGSQFVDLGTYLRTYAYGLKRVGRCPERYWKFSKSRVNRRPSIRAYQKANAMRGLRGYYRIYDRGRARIEAICAALDAGKPVVFGVRVDRAFTNSVGPNVIGVPAGAIIGGHAMCIVGYRVVGGALEFKIINSWGKGWRAGGYAWFNEELITWPRLEDIWVASL